MSDPDLNAWAGRLHKMAGPQLRAALEQAGIEIALTAEGKAKDLARTRMRVRTGRLHRSIAGTVAATPSGADVTLSAGGRAGGADVVYARIQELGGKITPKKGKWLTIPMPAALTAAGVTRKGARDYGDLRFQSGRDGSVAWLVQDLGDGRSRLMFKLVRKVQIKPKYYLRDGFNRAIATAPAAFAEAFQGTILQASS